MGNNELFKTIEQLKETLAEISSARQQVSDTVSAYAQTQTEIHSYTKHLMEIENVLSKLISLLQNNEVTIEQQSSSVISNLNKSCDTILSKTKDGLAAVSHKFAEDTTANIDFMDKQIEKFNHIIENAGQLTSRVELISTETKKLVSLITVLQKDFSSSQTVQNDNINRIQSSLSGQLQTANGTLKGIVASFSKQETILEQQGAILESLSISCNTIVNDITKLNVLCGNIQDSVKSYCNNIQTSIDFLKKESEELQQTVYKEAKSNRYLCIRIMIGIIISIILQFVIK